MVNLDAPLNSCLLSFILNIKMSRSYPNYDYQRELFYWGDHNGDQNVQHELWLNQGGIQYPILETRILAQCIMDSGDIRLFTNRTRYFTTIACLDHQHIDECEETNSLTRNRVLCQNHNEREEPFPLLTFQEAEKVVVLLLNMSSCTLA